MKKQKVADAIKLIPESIQLSVCTTVPPDWYEFLVRQDVIHHMKTGFSKRRMYV
jgi:hypothetical protein